MNFFQSNYNFISPNLGPCKNMRKGSLDKKIILDLFELPIEVYENIKKIHFRMYQHVCGPAEYFWWDDNKVEISLHIGHDKKFINKIRSMTGGRFSSLSLQEQAHVLEIPVIELDCEFINKRYICNDIEFKSPELFYIEYLKNYGKKAVYNEGAIFHCILNSAYQNFKKLYKSKALWGPHYRGKRFSKCVGDIYSIDRQHRVDVYDHLTEKSVIKYFKKDISQRLKIQIEDVKTVFNFFGVEFFKKLETIYQFSIGLPYHGWPDINILDDNSFVEVKAGKDKLHTYQAYWSRCIAKPLNLNYKIVHINTF